MPNVRNGPKAELHLPPFVRVARSAVEALT